MKIFNLDAVQSTDYTCGPLVLSCLIPLPEMELAKQAQTRSHRGTSPGDMVEVLKVARFDVKGRWDRPLQAPSICLIQEQQNDVGDQGHWVLVVDLTERHVIYKDPLYPGLQSMDRASFESLWYDTKTVGGDWVRFAIHFIE